MWSELLSVALELRCWRRLGLDLEPALSQPETAPRPILQGLSVVGVGRRRFSDRCLESARTLVVVPSRRPPRHHTLPYACTLPGLRLLRRHRLSGGRRSIHRAFAGRRPWHAGPGRGLRIL